VGATRDRLADVPSWLGALGLDLALRGNSRAQCCAVECVAEKQDNLELRSKTFSIMPGISNVRSVCRYGVSGCQMVAMESLQRPIAVPVAIALGSNLGDSLKILESALALLDQTPGISLEGQSRWYQTQAVGPPQPDYVNGCARLKVDLPPLLLLQTLLQIELTFGRVRRERNGPRTLDLDLLLFGDLVIETPSLQIPHPRMTERAFVLVPLAEIAPDWVEPISGKAIASLAQTVDCSGVKLLSL